MQYGTSCRWQFLTVCRRVQPVVRDRRQPSDDDPELDTRRPKACWRSIARAIELY